MQWQVLLAEGAPEAFSQLKIRRDFGCVSGIFLFPHYLHVQHCSRNFRSDYVLSCYKITRDFDWLQKVTPRTATIPRAFEYCILLYVEISRLFRESWAYRQTYFSFGNTMLYIIISIVST